MKLQVIGIEINEGKSTKEGKVGQPYAIGTLHCVLPLSQPRAKEGTYSIAKGMMSKAFRVETGILKKVQHIEPPYMAELVTAEVMRFGEMQQDVVEVRPLDMVSPARAKVPA